MKKILLILIFTVLSTAAFSQKKQLVEYKEDIIKMAVAELDIASRGPDGAIFKESAGISGQYVFDITIREKGKTATVFVVNDGINPINMQNRLKDIVKQFRYSFKVPKGKSYKFEYTFNF